MSGVHNNIQYIPPVKYTLHNNTITVRKDLVGNVVIMERTSNYLSIKLSLIFF